MAVTKTRPIKRALKAAIDYICNPEKTDAGDGDDDRFREAADHVEDAAFQPAGVMPTPPAISPTFVFTVPPTVPRIRETKFFLDI